MVPTWSTPRDQLPTWRGLLHAGAFAVVIPASVVLVARAADGPARLAMAVYGASLVLAFGSSAAYHRLARTERAQRVLQSLDHSSIFALIAGSYTPMCVIALPRGRGVPLVAALWSVAVAGILLKVFGFHRFRTLGYWLYAVAAGVAALGLPQLWRAVSGTQFVLLVLGGVLYIAGVPVLRWGRPNPWPRTFGYHEVWHAFTVAAGASQLAAIALFVL